MAKKSLLANEWFAIPVLLIFSIIAGVFGYWHYQNNLPFLEKYPLTSLEIDVIEAEKMYPLEVALRVKIYTDNAEDIPELTGDEFTVELDYVGEKEFELTVISGGKIVSVIERTEHLMTVDGIEHEIEYWTLEKEYSGELEEEFDRATLPLAYTTAHLFPYTSIGRFRHIETGMRTFDERVEEKVGLTIATYSGPYLEDYSRYTFDLEKSPRPIKHEALFHRKITNRGTFEDFVHLTDDAYVPGHYQNEVMVDGEFVLAWESWIVTE